ncbi:hypothetical protein AGMMS49543_27770 [Betaproteobacteria bacterium]|nr:hypothetical protein AGMMS49543_27770 [Betaproteobacteria bacterium]GHT90286.1 hypothetical protein AGMMS49545_03390 [Betaproteobacteria bacterium]GHU16435.1 hypothetical protein AGMMS50243_02520 [Betaproteobacteria bacterium]GHU46159.1 hypothetical protein AGMMS50289_18890 [Betaproteobacteria bacterium]
MSAETIVWDAARSALGVPEMDVTHREFVTQVAELIASDAAAFPARFSALVEHTRAHFAAEDANMQATHFPARSEHNSEHRRVLEEMGAFQRALQSGRSGLARTYVRDGIPAWFRQHLATMDSALAAHLKKQGAGVD